METIKVNLRKTYTAAVVGSHVHRMDDMVTKEWKKRITWKRKTQEVLE